ncbi:unnamed protein product [Peniophora sp. CBMAI 1063]|nr:unnamed protein product [Peniophora sp. CBMAI 1063]
MFFAFAFSITMAGKNRTLNKLQVSAVATILAQEFAAVVRDSDPTFTRGFAAVSGWVRERKLRLFAEDPCFQTWLVLQAEKAYKKAVDSKFRNYYHKLRAVGSGRTCSGGPLNNKLAPRSSDKQLHKINIEYKPSDETVDRGTGSGDAKLNQLWLGLKNDVRPQYVQKSQGRIPKTNHNVGLLASNIESSLESLCRDKALEGMVALTFLGYRDEAGTIQLSLCNGRPDDLTLQLVEVGRLSAETSHP